MGARSTMLVAVAVAVAVVAGSSIARADDPKPKPVDITPFRDKLVVLEDGQGGTYVVLNQAGDSRIWFGNGATLYEQIDLGYSANGDAWDISVWAPRVTNMQPGSIQRKDDGSFHRWCGSEHDLPLKPITADRVKTALARVKLMSPNAIRASYLLARDDAGKYYYVDRIRDRFGGGGYRVFVGKKGAMKQLPLTDVATDAAGDVFATSTGEVRFVHDAGEKQTATWIHGSDKSSLSLLDVDVASRLIFKDLGIYTFLGTLCDDI
ncbi:MAG TPA: hypothetical protein VGG28_03435 [Kofleriaceae bacterium]|jgi:hypothetical protein